MHSETIQNAQSSRRHTRTPYPHAHASVPQQRLRVVIQQPALPKYRVPLFASIAADPEIDLHVIHGEQADLQNAQARGFTATRVDETHLKLAAGRALWHSPQLACASPRKCDVLVMSTNLRYLSLPLGLIRAAANGTRTLLWGHHRSHCHGRLGNAYRKSAIFPLADGILTYDEDTAAELRQASSLHGRVFVAPNSLDQEPIKQAKDYWQNRPQALQAFRQANGIGRGPHLLFVSRIKPRNALDTLLGVVAALRDKYPGLTATIIGRHNDEQRRLVTAAQELGIEHALRFPGAIYDEHNLAPWFLSADAFLYPARIGLSIFHAMGYGLPVIAGLGHNNPEALSLEHERNGLAFESGRIDEAAQCVRRVFDDRALARRLSLGAVQTVLERFNIEVMADSFLKAIKAVGYNQSRSCVEYPESWVNGGASPTHLSVSK